MPKIKLRDSSEYVKPKEQEPASISIEVMADLPIIPLAYSIQVSGVQPRISGRTYIDG